MKISNYRYERKFFITELSKHKVEAVVKLHPYIFNEIFYERQINNIYFDTHNFKNLHDNVDGVFDRTKVRVRWYGDLFGYIAKPILEIKIKKGLLGKKISVPIEPFDFNENSDLSGISKSIDNINNEISDDLGHVIPTLLNRYTRKYYQSNDKKYRITIDSDQSFYYLNNKNNLYLNHYSDTESVILELKYDEAEEFNANNITTKFPFRVTKSSKYVNGIEKIFQINY